MPKSRIIWIQMALVAVLFLGSLVILLLNAFASLPGPGREAEARRELEEAGRRLAAAVAPVAREWADRGDDQRGDLDRRLETATREVLQNSPGVEGGVYLADQQRFSGWAFPTDRVRPPGPPPHPHNEPPPREAYFIRAQAQQSVAQNQGITSTREVGPSRVLIRTVPIAIDGSPHWAVWTMFRLTGPDQLEGQVRAYRVSMGLALGGLALSLVLTVNLGRSLSRQYREQDRLREGLRRSEHLAALGKLLAGVAHEVRNPLAGIRSTVQLWQRLPETARTEGSMEAVIRAVDRLNDLVTRLLYFARPGRSEWQPVAINQLLQETLQLLAAQAAAQSVVLETDLDPAVPPLSGSPDGFRQVFLNLARNAIQAMPQGGRLTCRTSSRDGVVEIRFADTGPGVALEDRAHLFEPFFTTRPEGTGLGLALCREIVVQYGGKIEFAPNQGPGAVFRVMLPAAGANLEGGGERGASAP